MKEIGISSMEELYSDVPGRYQLSESLDLPATLAELEVKKHVETLLSRNHTFTDVPPFLGAGCYHHYVPAAVREIVRRSELSTSYTPYQPEVSQGILQALFEYQSMICELTGMEVANSSMYDWASALGEAARMAARLTGRSEILIPEIIHPARLAALHIYAEPAEITVRKVAYDQDTGQISPDSLKGQISEKTAAVYIENPSFLGFIETQVDEIGSEAHDNGALFMVGVDPTSLGVLRPPGDYGADVVIGEGQPLGNPQNFGGPLLGIFACRGDLRSVRQMPGRIVGLTTTLDESRLGYCMAMQTREQHIRREKATSNICTNEALCAVASAMYLALLGPNGMRELGEMIAFRASYAIRLLSSIAGVRVPIFRSAHFKEFTVNFEETGFQVRDVNEELLKHGIQGGKDLSLDFPELGQTALYCVTEMHTKSSIDRLAADLRETLDGR